jgi:hypothetical protein
MRQSKEDLESQEKRILRFHLKMAQGRDTGRGGHGARGGQASRGGRAGRGGSSPNVTMRASELGGL